MNKTFTVETKLWKVMKLCAIQLMIAVTVCSMVAAHDNYAQLLDKKVTISLEEVPFEVALKEIETAIGIKVYYSIDQLHVNDPVSIEARNETLRVVLDKLLGPHNIRYKVDERKASIFLKKQSHEPTGESHAPPRQDDNKTLRSLGTITGEVRDAVTTQPMTGVNVVVRGTTIGTTTDAEGKYVIQAEDSDALVFTFIGYATFETQVHGHTVINVVLSEDIKSLNEVVINAGYWQVTDREKTGNIAQVEAKDIQNQPVQNPLAALQGRVAGLQVIQSTGVPGGNFTVRIRGINSISNGNDPLYIVDGVPYTSTAMTFSETAGNILAFGTSPLNNINPADIETIEVLKDADATAVYGSRGSNGVILITTKKGQAGKTRVNFNFYSGVGRVAAKLDQFDTPHYLAMRKEAFANDNVEPELSNAKDLVLWDTTRNTDWQKELLGGTANITDAQVSISGGEGQTTFSVGIGYHGETTVFPGDNGDKRLSSHITIGNTSNNQKLKTSVSVNYLANHTDLLNQDLTIKALYLPPNAPPLYTENGDINWEGWDAEGAYENPIAYLNRRYEAKTGSLIGSIDIGYSILPNLEVKSRFGYTSTMLNSVNLTPLSSLAPAMIPYAQNTTRFSSSTFRNWVVEPQAIWKPRIGKTKLEMLLGTQFLDQSTEGLAQVASGFSSEALMKNVAAAPNRSVGTNYYTQYRYHAVFGRVNYNLADKYIINLTGRRDGSSRFGPGNQFANFGAVGVAWIFTNEQFVKNSLPFFSFGKLRASYGTTGNDQLADYQYLDAFKPSAAAYQNVVGLTPVRLANPDFAWETNRKLEAALELAFLKDRILTSVSYYKNKSSSQLVGYPLPPTTGFSTIQANFPATVQNTGVEVELNTLNVQRNGFSWRTSLNLSVPKNKLLEFPNLEASPAYANYYVVGEPLSIAKGFRYTGVDAQTGLYQFEDVNEDGVFDDSDKRAIKFIGSYLYGGLQNSFAFKGFQLDIFLQFSKQDLRNYIFSKDAPGRMSNQPKWVMDRWQSLGDETDIQRYGQSFEVVETYGRLSASDRSVSDASFIRVKNLSISYTLPEGWVNKIKASNVRLFVLGQNLLTITDYEGLDPETGNSFLPPLKVLTGGITLTF